MEVVGGALFLIGIGTIIVAILNRIGQMRPTVPEEEIPDCSDGETGGYGEDMR